MQQSSNKAQEVLVREHFENHAVDWQSIYQENDFSSFIIQQRQYYTFKYIDSLGLMPGSRILDLGCGAGLNSVKLLQRGFSVVGIDVSDNMLDLARKNCLEAGSPADATFQLGNAEELDFPDDSFDAVVAMGLIEYLKWDRWALQEMHRVLKPGGYLIVTVPNSIRISHLTNPRWWMQKIINRATDKLRKIAKKFGYPKTKRKGPKSFVRRVYIPSHLRQMIAGLDFEVKNSFSHGFGPFRLLRRSNKLTFKVNDILEKWRDRGKSSFLSELGSNYIVLCQKKPQPAGVGKREIFQDIVNRTKYFKSGKKDLFSRLEAWRNNNREYADLSQTQLNIKEYSQKYVLVISPHPDDEIIGCGGTLIKMIKGGVKVVVLQVTDGSTASALIASPESVRKTARLEEARVVAENLGLAELILWGESCTNLECNSRNVQRLVEILGRLNPKAIFVPFINDWHPDHILANKMLYEALRISAANLAEVNIFSYEVWSLVPANLYCIIDEQFDEKAKMLMKYRIGMKAFDYVHFCESLNAYHAYTLIKKRGFLEVYFNLNAKAYMELIEKELLLRAKN
ncbi:methyltransferase domain-containing protein [bacterium]|nr:MAG: methyltransferase domain-containing protein [bacterium]